MCAGTVGFVTSTLPVATLAQALVIIWLQVKYTVCGDYKKLSSFQLQRM